MYNNLCELHRTTSDRLGDRIALRYKQDGLFRNLSWREYRQQADRAAAGLLSLGIEQGDRIAILSENRFEWLVADAAMLSVAAVTVPLHAPLATRQVAYQVGHSQSRGIIVSGPEQAAKVFESLDQLPDLEFIVAFEPIVDPQPGIQCLTWESLKHRAIGNQTNAATEIAQCEANLTHADLATIIYTSGTTGDPKGVMLTHGNLVTNACATAEPADFGPNDILLSWLPYSHIYARTVDIYLSIATRGLLCLGGPVEELLDDLKAVHPTWLTAVPRFYEKIWSAVESLESAKRKETLRKMFGPRLRQLSSGGAPLPQHICEGFFESDIPLFQGYGLTESSPVISFNGFHANRIGSVGQAIPGVDVKIAEDGEILTRGPHVMPGYWRNEQATAETIVDDWLYTGDVGRLDADGYLFITDRKKEIIVTSSGKNISPSEIERLLISDPYIDQAVAYGDGRQFISALIVPNEQLLQELVDEKGFSIEKEGEFICTPEILEHFQQRIDDVMQSVSRPEQVRRFLLLGRALTLDRDELTATLKVRRRFVVSEFESQLSQLYADQRE